MGTLNGPFRYVAYLLTYSRPYQCTSQSVYSVCSCGYQHTSG